MRNFCKYSFSIILSLIILLSINGLALLAKNFFLNRNEEPVLVEPEDPSKINVLFLHHSTGKMVWNGGVESYLSENNTKREKEIMIYEQDFPKKNPYGWNNYPYDYYNIWVKNGGSEPYKREPTLEVIEKHYDVVIFKHCFPASSIEPDSSVPDINSSTKTLGNYKLQYIALKEKLHDFNDIKFIIWTIPALVEARTNEDQALRAQKFVKWVMEEWNQPGDNIFIWDFNSMETEDGIYLKTEYSSGELDSHPSKEFSSIAAESLVDRLLDVVDNQIDV